ncbi:TOMM precursor leader peptide-binding protein [Kineosporia rhizophila]|uniref:TOMM precursor leader peptide-binding protein n=1 Tax=Kineosporia TaxID=49184 RepID=UPI001E2F3BFE|nr:MULTISPECIES: TOMM precursor leader peptide-binding protein [Kineosporia]MCE0536830.1 TOMM precursor leader peptide-binding protein [Kineosporia rhizophila]
MLVSHGIADAARADYLMSADIPHLAVVVGEDGVVVGPLVRPGRTPCLRCLDLHRRDRDPDWPRVLSQLPEHPFAEHEETASASLAAGLAALQVLAELDGLSQPAAVGATLEVELPDGLVARRPWRMHPACGCAWPTPSPTRPG